MRKNQDPNAQVDLVAGIAAAEHERDERARSEDSDEQMLMMEYGLDCSEEIELSL